MFFVYSAYDPGQFYTLQLFPSTLQLAFSMLSFDEANTKQKYKRKIANVIKKQDLEFLINVHFSHSF